MNVYWERSDLDASDWPLSSRAQQTRLWLATVLNAAKTRCKKKPLTFSTHKYALESLKAEVYQREQSRRGTLLNRYCVKPSIVTFLNVNIFLLRKFRQRYFPL